MKRFICLLIGLLMLAVLCSCRDDQPVMAEVFASDGGAGRTKTTAPADTDDGTVTICLDPGHGFDDVGTDSDYLGALTEKDITLAVTLLIKDKLEAMGYEVMLTHDGETFPKSSIDDENNLFNPKERIDYVSELDIDFYLSIHCDTYEADTRVMG
ncbi:MAG: N-acetylmuramoyl-L-alanine amidase, partial [Clostridia bacterium]|nr:N-acetylmuramoyl-L-alanine amidase [Clostridia bacterium]